MFHQIRSWSPTVVLLICLLTASGAASAGDFKLTILHNNDGESQLIDAGEGLEDFGGVDRFKTLADQLKKGRGRALRFQRRLYLSAGASGRRAHKSHASG